jgi:hypothetical protein
MVQSAQKREGFCMFVILMEPGRVQCLSHCDAQAPARGVGGQKKG